MRTLIEKNRIYNEAKDNIFEEIHYMNETFYYCESHCLTLKANIAGTPIPMSKLVKDVGVQTDNTFSPSTQCTQLQIKPDDRPSW